MTILSQQKSIAMRSQWRLSPWWRKRDLAVDELSFLRVVNLCLDRGLPIADQMELFMLENDGLKRNRLRKFTSLLRKGTPWIDAIEQTTGLLSDETVLALRVGIHNGTVRSVLARLLEEQYERSRSVVGKWSDKLIYYGAVLFAFLLLMLLFNYRISPRLALIGKEFDAHESSYLHFHQSFWNAFYSMIPMVLLGVIVLGMLIAWVRPLRRFRTALGASLFPRMQKGASLPIRDLISMCLEEGRPIASFLSTMARYHKDPYTRSQLLFARNEIEQGRTPWESLQVSGFLDRDEYEALTSVQSTNTQAWMLRMSTRDKRLRCNHRWSMFQRALDPMFVLFFGGIVLWTAMVLFGFLSSLSLGVKP